jgi:hypothetical protein
LIIFGKIAILEVAIVETNRKSFKKMFPKLSEEFESGDNKVSINTVRKDREEAGKTDSDRFHNYNPTVIDFIRRCDTKKQAKEIIAYVEKKGEITRENAAKLRNQLEKEGVRSFGPKKEDNYYFKKGGFC